MLRFASNVKKTIPKILILYGKSPFLPVKNYYLNKNENLFGGIIKKPLYCAKLKMVFNHYLQKEFVEKTNFIDNILYQ